MADIATPQTPPGRIARLHVPGAPRHGAFHDNNGPLSPRRSRRNTRNPYSSASSANGNDPFHRAMTPPPHASPPSPPMSPLPSDYYPTTPHKNKVVHNRNGKLKAPKWDPDGLITPAKTPAQTSTLQTPPSTGTSRRVIFQFADPSHAMPTPRKLKKATRTATFAGCGRAHGSEDIEVYNDSNLRMPTRDESADNPFMLPPTPATGHRQRQQSEKPRPLKANMTNAEMQVRVQNDEGLIFMFRGKQMFRPYADTAETRQQAEALGYQPVSRSSIQPKRLDFGGPQASDDVDEEAMTDIEEEPSLDNIAGPSEIDEHVTTATPRPFKEWARTKRGLRKRAVEGGHDSDAAKKSRSGN